MNNDVTYDQSGGVAILTMDDGKAMLSSGTTASPCTGWSTITIWWKNA